jgi:major vault protein
LDAEKNEHIITGPTTYILEPDEHVKVLWLSAKKPKIPYQIRAAIIKLGPDFVSDKFVVRTKDNAQLEMELSYKWQFIVDQNDAHLVFSMQDFIGYACSTLCSKIREEAAAYKFEDFHNGTVSILRKGLFKKHIINEVEMEGMYFDGNKLLISEIDVKSMVPVNSEINALL